MKTTKPKSQTKKSKIELRPWLFNGLPLPDDYLSDYEGFVYLIFHRESGRYYIGRKYTSKMRKEKGSLRRKKSESDWQNYTSSSKSLQEEIKANPAAFERHILSIHETQAQTNFYEVFWQFQFDVLNDPKSINDNAAGKWFKAYVSGYPRLFSQNAAAALTSKEEFFRTL